MLDFMIRSSLRHRFTVIFLALALGVSGIWMGLQLPIDVFPDLNKPRVTILAEAHGLAPDEVESLVTIPIEKNLQGIPGVVQLRSDSGLGISILYLDFEWGSDPFRNRQLVAEKLGSVRRSLPKDVDLVMAPMTSIMGEIQFVGLTFDQSIDHLKVRQYADWVLKPALLGVSGISQIVVMGGGSKEVQVHVDPEKLVGVQHTFQQITEALINASKNTTGGVLNSETTESIIRPLGRAEHPGQLAQTFVGRHLGQPIKLGDIAAVKFGAKEKRGEASIDSQHAVILTIQKQPGQDTVDLTEKIGEVLDQVAPSVPEGVTIRRDLFKQANFIELAIRNVAEALRDGTLIVAVVLFLFLLNVRTTMITLTAIPLSFATTFLIFHWFGLDINTMTLGGLAIAVGELVDDAIVDVENVFRRLRENQQLSQPKPALEVVFQASKEVRSSLVLSTGIVVAVFIPLFALAGLSGRFFTPMGIAYIVSLTSSLLISLTLTPVLCLLFLPKAKAIKAPLEAPLVRFIKNVSRPMVMHSIQLRWLIIGIAIMAVGVSFWRFQTMGTSFLPNFNEGTATIGVASYPGISLPESDKLGIKLEQAILSVPEVKSTVRRTGRAEQDEHAEGVHWHEIDVDFHPFDRAKNAVLDDIRAQILKVGDVHVNIGQPISHRIDHMLSGIRSQIAIKVFGNDAVELRRMAVEVKDRLAKIEGVVDLSIEPLVKVPQLAIEINPFVASNLGIVPGQLSETLESMLVGVVTGYMIKDGQRLDIRVRLGSDFRSKIDQIKKLPVGYSPTGIPIRLSDVADIYETDGPNHVKRENLQRRLIVSANGSGRALTDIVDEAKKSIDEMSLPRGYRIAIDGQYKEITSSQQSLLLLAGISFLSILFILFVGLRSVIAGLIVLLNIPLAMIGSVWALSLAGLDLSLATSVAFVTLCGIACRNGLLMVNHFYAKANEAPDQDIKAIIVSATLERIIPVLMTAGTAILALMPLILAGDETGKEILFPVAVVVVGGLTTSTLLNTLVIPAAFYPFAKGLFLKEKARSSRSLGDSL